MVGILIEGIYEIRRLHNCLIVGSNPTGSTIIIMTEWQWRVVMALVRCVLSSYGADIRKPADTDLLVEAYERYK